MKIREILREDADISDNDISKISAIVSQIARRYEATGTNNPPKIQSILTVLNDSGINIDEQGFRDLVDSDPLENIISSIEGDDVIFLGYDDDSESIKPDHSTGTLEKMAKRASKKRES